MALVLNGDGTVTGLAVGGLPDGTVDDGTVASGIASSKLTGALPAISGASLTGLPQSFTGAVTATTDMVVQATSSSRKMFMGVSSDDLAIGNYSNSNATRNEHLKITSDGRGLSQFTAKAWVNFNGTGTVAIRDSHNVSSITDNAVGTYGINFSNSLGSTNYVPTSSYNTAVSNNNPHHHVSTFATSSYVLNTYENNTKTDQTYIMALVFGD